MAHGAQIYFDPNVYRLITRKIDHWKKFKEAVDEAEPGLLERSSVMFSWCQLLEECNLGTIMSQIEKSQVWRDEIEEKGLLDSLAYQEALDKYFSVACEAIASLPELQKEALLMRIDKAISHKCPEAWSLVNDTLLRYRAFVNEDKYKDELTLELAWAFLTSYPFVQSYEQWCKRKNCFDGLIVLWHKLFIEGHDLVFFRLCERRYFASLLYSLELDMEEVKAIYSHVNTKKDLENEIFKTPALKPTSDLCDGELIHYAYLGGTLGACRSPVICITRDNPAIIHQRMGIFDRALTDLKQCVNGWGAEIHPGKILPLEMTKDGTIGHLYRILPRQACCKL